VQLLVGFRAGRGMIVCVVAILASGCGSTIHIEDNVGGTDTLSVDAKQRLMLVGTRPPTRPERGDFPIRVTCTEPSPDALVARAAALSASGTLSPPAGEVGGSAGLAASSSEAAASIGFRNQTVQMLRDGYFRLCEAYLNGALSKEHYETMVTNADTFMAVVSALEVLGAQPTAPSVAIMSGGATATTGTSTAGTPAGAVDVKPIVINNPGGAKSDANAVAVAQIVREYLNYRRTLNLQVMAAEKRYPR
jgi:hypothetical protein